MTKSMNRRPTKPIIRWVGGKRFVADDIADKARAYLESTDGEYIEPFVGGAAVALRLAIEKMTLSDTCEPLVTAYSWAKARPIAVFAAIHRLVSKGTGEEVYKRIRSQRPAAALDRAAWFFYLNALCFNGLWRVNSKGVYNVPYGQKGDKACFVSRQRLQDFSHTVQTSAFNCEDFEKPIDRVKQGDLIFADPPYFRTFSNYSSGSFEVSDQIRLARSLKRARGRGAEFIVTNSDTEEIRNLYRWVHIKSTAERRNVNRDGKRRGKVACLRIASSKNLL